MKLVQYKISTALGFVKRLGFLSGETIVDPQLVWSAHYQHAGFYNHEERAKHKISHSLFENLQTKEDTLALLKMTEELYQKIKKAGLEGNYEIGEFSKTKLEAPLDQIATYRDFYAHEKHVRTGFKKRNEEIPPAWFEIPAYYKGATTGFLGHQDEVLWPSYTDVLDYELELGMVIGRDGMNIKEKDAHKHIFGFTILNDISARDIQRKEMSIRLGPAKGKDFCSVIGPVIVTFDEFQNSEPNLLMTAKINGDEWSRGHSQDSHYSWAQMIEHVAKDEWVVAGDLFGSGTVGTGCGLELDKWIKSGDILELEIEKIGKLINKVGTKKKEIK